MLGCQGTPLLLLRCAAIYRLLARKPEDPGQRKPMDGVRRSPVTCRLLGNWVRDRGRGAAVPTVSGGLVLMANVQLTKTYAPQPNPSGASLREAIAKSARSYGVLVLFVIRTGHTGEAFGESTPSRRLLSGLRRTAFQVLLGGRSRLVVLSASCPQRGCWKVGASAG